MRNWETTPLRKLVSFQKGRKVEVSDYASSGFAPYLGASELAGAGESIYGRTQGAVLAEPNDVLMLWDGERSGLVGTGKSGVVSSTVAKLSPSPDINGRFLYYALINKFDWIQGRRTGTGVPHVPKDIGRILRLSYPRELADQKRIAEILSTVDKAIEQTEALIVKTQQIKAGLMHDLFTRGVTADGKLRPSRKEAPQLYKESPLGWIPKEWEVARLKDIARRVTDGSHQAVSTSLTGEIPFLYVSCVHDGEIVWENAAKITIDTYLKISPGRPPKPGIILYTAVGSYGNAALVSSSELFAFQRHIAYIDATDSILEPGFLVWYLNSEMAKRHADRTAEGNAQKTITLRELSKFPILVPPKPEHIAIQSALDKSFALLRDQKAEQSKLFELKRGLMEDLLSGRVRPAGIIHTDSASVVESV